MKTYAKVIGWGVLWLIVWILTLPFKGKRHNCLSWSIEKWESEGGYLVMRWCRQNKKSWLVWPHFLWIPEGQSNCMFHVISSTDHENDDRFLPKIWFDPKVIEGDPWDV